MKRRYYSEQVVQEALRLVTEIGICQTARKLKIPQSTISSWKQTRERNDEDQEPENVDNGHKDLAISSLKRQLAEVQSRNIEDISAVWGYVERENEKKIHRLHELTDVRVSLSGDRPIGLAAFSDFHITSGCTNLRRLREDGELLADTDGAYGLLIGDYIDNHVKHRAAVVSRDMSPTREMELFNYWLSIVRDSVLAMVSGNHDAFSTQASGLDPLTSIAERNRLYYTPDELNLSLEFGSQTYRIMLRHRTLHNSGLNHAHGLFRHLERSANEPWDIGISGHHHVCTVASQVILGKMRYAIRPGSYQVSTSFSRALGFCEAQPFSPMVILWPNERKISMYHDVRLGLEVLKKLRA